MRETGPAIDRVTGSAFRVPTDAPEADGTFSWDRTTMVIAEVSAGGKSGLGYSYADAAAAHLINDLFAGQVLREDAFAIPRMWDKLVARVRNIGWRGICANAISAVDVALWDLKARLLGRSSCRFSAPRGAQCRSTGAAVSPPIRSSGSPSSWRAGSRTTVVSGSR